jgi:urease accessory protein
MKSSTIRHSRYALASLPLLAASIVPAFAHHMEGGKLPDSFAAGLLSGVGHPIIGLDHFAFIAGVGIALAFLPRGFIAIVAFVAATVVGCALHLRGATLPGAEIVISGSVLLVGAAIMSGRVMPTILAAVVFALAGLFHGYAYGEAIFGAEQTPVAAYLIGFAAIQTAIAATAMLVTRSLAPVQMASATPARLAGAVIAGVGLTFMVQNIESIVIPAPAPIVTPSA